MAQGHRVTGAQAATIAVAVFFSMMPLLLPMIALLVLRLRHGASDVSCAFEDIRSVGVNVMHLLTHETLSDRRKGVVSVRLSNWR